MAEATSRELEAQPRADEELCAEKRPREVGRIEAFSDGVFAIAITLLSLELIVPLHEDLRDALSGRWSNFFALALSFAVIGSYWMFHHRLFTAVVRYDRRLIWLNLLVLFFIVLMPFATSVIADYGDEPLGVIIYAVNLAGAGLANAVLTAYIFAGRRMCARTVTDGHIRYVIVRSLVVPVYFAASLLLLLLPGSTSKVTWSWIAIPLVVALVDRRLRREDR